MGYRVNSVRATQFHLWTTQVLREFAIRFLEFADNDPLQSSGKVMATIANEFAESEFEKHSIIQDRLFESDFDRVLKVAQ